LEEVLEVARKGREISEKARRISEDSADNAALE
ncbi:unnamed protein product, partial [marine sediment metagenome]